MDDARWVQCTPPEHAWERAALNYLKDPVTEHGALPRLGES